MNGEQAGSKEVVVGITCTVRPRHARLAHRLALDSAPSDLSTLALICSCIILDSEDLANHLLYSAGLEWLNRLLNNKEGLV